MSILKDEFPVAAMDFVAAGEASGKINSILLLGLALTESTAIYGFVSALIMMFTLGA